MAHPITITLGTGNKVSADYQSQEAHITVTYELERHETDIQVIVLEKAEEIESLHSAFWRRMRDIRAEQQATRPDATTGGGIDGRSGRNGHATRRRSDAQEGTAAMSKTATAAQSCQTAPLDTDAAAIPPDPPSAEALTPQVGPPTDAPTAEAPPASPVVADPVTVPQLHAIRSLVTKTGVDQQRLHDFLKGRWGKLSIETLTRTEAGALLLELQRAERHLATAPVAA